MNSIKKKSISTLIEGLSKYEADKDAVKKSDYTDLKTFIKDYLNTKRTQAAEETGGGISQTAHGTVPVPEGQCRTDRC